MFKNFTKCERCIYNQVCVFETEQKELIDKMEVCLNSARPSKIFNIILECKVYKPNEEGAGMTNYEYIMQFFQHTNEHAFAEFLVVKIDDYNYTSNILFENFTTRQEAINATVEKLKDIYNVNEFGLYDKIFKQIHSNDYD